MLGFVLAASLAAAPPSPNVDARIAASAAAAQALQGSLDGTWVLADHKGRPLYVFQIVEPPSGGLEAAWRAPGATGALGLVDAIDRRRDRLTLAFTPSGVAANVKLQWRGGAWRGVLRRGDEIFDVRLVRD